MTTAANIKKSKAHRLYTQLVARGVMDRAQIAERLGVDEHMLASFERGERSMDLDVQWRFSTIIAAAFQDHSAFRSLALALRAQLVTTSAYHAHDTTTHNSSPPGPDRF